MAGSPKFKIYRDKEYVGAVKFAEDAAALVGVSGMGVVKYDHKHIVWREGSEPFPAGDSWDLAAQYMNYRVARIQENAFISIHGELPDDYTPATPPDGCDKI